jgi:hypothetical protein
MADSVETLVSRFPGPVKLYPSRKKWLLLLVACIAFTAGGVFMARDHADGGWFVLIFFGLGLVFSIVMLLPGASGLLLDGDGFKMTNLYRSHRSRWQDVQGFQAVAIPPSGQILVCYDDSGAARSSLAKMNIAITGHNSALPETYGLSADDLARLMTQWRNRALP